MFWRDFRATSRMSESYFGDDLQMELGNSFVADIFGGWVPVPVRTCEAFHREPTFRDGLAWRQHLSWTHHKIRPRYRAHYSITIT